MVKIQSLRVLRPTAFNREVMCSLASLERVLCCMSGDCMGLCTLTMVGSLRPGVESVSPCACLWFAGEPYMATLVPPGLDLVSFGPYLPLPLSKLKNSPVGEQQVHYLELPCSKTCGLSRFANIDFHH